MQSWSLTRRSLLVGGLGVAFLPRDTAIAKAEKQTALQIGLCKPAYYNGFSPFLNWWKQSAPHQLTTKDRRTLAGHDVWDEGDLLDRDTGELTTTGAKKVSAFSRIFFAPSNGFQKAIGCDYSGEEFAVVWDGCAEVRVDFLTAGSTQHAVGTNHIVFRMGSDPGNTGVTFTITDADRPPTNINIYQTRYASNVAKGEVFNPDWLGAVGKFKAVRCMDWLSVNNGTISEFSQLADINYCSWGQAFEGQTQNGEYGPKGGVHPRLLAELANRAQVNIQVCIPHLATDDFIESFAKYLKNHCNEEVTYEFSNECWNYAFSQCRDLGEAGKRLWPNDSEALYKYYGYRSAECMNIIRRVYGGNQKWRGALATQTVNPNVTLAMLAGVNDWITRNSERMPNVTVKSLFKDLMVTGYFGDVTNCTRPTSITRSSPAVVTSPAHGYESGEVVRFFVPSGMTQLDQREASVQRLDENSYAIDIDTSVFDPYQSDSISYATSSRLFKLMDSSEEKYRQNPAEFPEPYTYFNRQVSQSLASGKCEAGVATQINVGALREKFWPAQLAIAKSQQLSLRQYEGGCHLVGDAYLNGFGGNARYTDFLLHHSHSQDAASVYKAMYQGFQEVGGQYPSKYLLDGPVSQFGSWAAVRFWPTAANRASIDTANPVWLATVASGR